MDLTTNDEDGRPWDFDNAEQRSKAREQLRRDQPLVLIGSPMCTAFCRLQSINFARMDPDRVRAILSRARMHLNFVCSLYEEQVKAGRFFLHEHPAGASSWNVPGMQRLMSHHDVHYAKMDQCMYWQNSRNSHGIKTPARKNGVLDDELPGSGRGAPAAIWRTPFSSAALRSQG